MRSKTPYGLMCFGVLAALAMLQVACVDVNAPLESGDLPLHQALEARDAAEVQRLLEAGADPNLPGTSASTGLRRSALELAMVKGKGEMELIQALLEAGAKVGPKEVGVAAASRYPQYLQAMLAAGGEIPRVESSQTDTPIWNRLCGYGADSDGEDSVACARMLEERGISPRDPAYAHYPLHHAARWGNAELVWYLMERGFSANEANAYGSTPLMECNESPVIAKMLLAAGADVNARNNEGCTPLMQELIKPDVVRVLLEAGAKPNLCNQKGETALMFHLHHPDAIGGGYEDEHGNLVTWNGCRYNTPVIQALIEKGADVNKPDAAGETPLQAAPESEPELIRLLLSAGAK